LHRPLTQGVTCIVVHDVVEEDGRSCDDDCVVTRDFTPIDPESSP